MNTNCQGKMSDNEQGQLEEMGLDPEDFSPEFTGPEVEFDGTQKYYWVDSDGTHHYTHDREEAVGMAQILREVSISLGDPDVNLIMAAEIIWKPGVTEEGE